MLPSGRATTLEFPPTPYPSPVPVPVGRGLNSSQRPVERPLDAAYLRPANAAKTTGLKQLPDSLPFNSFHLAAEYNLYQVKAHLTSSTPSSEPSTALPPRHQAPPPSRQATPATVHRRSAPSSTATSDDDESRPVFTARAFHSSSSAFSSTLTTSSADCLHIPRWYYEEQLRQVVEQMDRHTVKNAPSQQQTAKRLSVATTPWQSPATPVCRTTSRTTTILRPRTPQLVHKTARRGHDDMLPRRTEKRQSPGALRAAGGRGGAKLAAITSETEREDSCERYEDEPRSGDGSEVEAFGGSVPSVGMNVRRMKLLEMANSRDR